ncbi:MAG: 50S ribosomal protein L25/general stress protein Ctc [Okeania sp. SIO2C9]|uniref:50S ribosomal protein L25/general stress protein Ctc n=1 Tax=Okeania sp. SIO2C9 TaxID=2607791 RepID=UPI0013BFE974|nr:50S ribosomal protein L25/general stress protein Ctc [Okeania sp. SIO2C9]NEQ77985.1 50S ribosomal protein L25/general stress protein Ctc [Okeania sp. SIO2C9]
MEVTVECQKRPEGSKTKALRREGLIPAVLYGHQGTESVPLTIEVKKAQKLLKDTSINNTIIDLQVPDISWSGKTILREVQSHPYKPLILHLSFFSVAAHGSLDVEVPIHLVGEPVGVKVDGGILDQVVTELAIRCKPDKIPETLEIDISSLKSGESLQLSQITLPEGVEAAGEADLVLARIMASVTTSSTESESESEGAE